MLQEPNLYPWRRLPRTALPIRLADAHADIDGLFDLPEGSALTLARVDAAVDASGDPAPAPPTLQAVRWRDSGPTGFYPASTIKWITAALTVAWMDGHGLTPDTVIAVGDDRPATLRDLILGCLVMSDNEAFNTLQEAAGFAETHAALRAWGVQHGLIRRHFTRPHWNHSREVRCFLPGGRIHTVDARPAADIPLNLDPRPAPLGNPEANYFTTDDFVISAAASLMGPTRDATSFPLLTQGLGWTNQNYIREGLSRVTADLPERPAFVTLSKPGWWPPDGANSEMAYVYDATDGGHYFLAIYIQGTNDEARAAMTEATRHLFAAVRSGRLVLNDPGR